MIRSLIKLGLVVLIANAAWRVGHAYLAHYRFTDAVQQLAHYRGDKSDSEVHARVFALASQYDIDVTDETLTIQKEDNRTIVDGAYRKPIEFLPSVIYAWPFTVHIDTPIVDQMNPVLPR